MTTFTGFSTYGLGDLMVADKEPSERKRKTIKPRGVATAYELGSSKKKSDARRMRKKRQAEREASR